ncbi:hypothetical protein CCR95_19390 [Thiocystis minor]|uniref:hypothetical protein n=1 Tax=Thiocystis minor TaxID=61597 RepID=UPI0019113058|nr:hypothetical protein [Thiocystis minor]MBK5966186.1 hypothetical protein [Thiocystis minor]
MNAAALLTEATQAGVSLAATERGTLKYSGDPSALERLLPEIRQHKAEILALLRDQDAPLLLSAETQADIQEAIDERAAIQEFDGGLLRQDAETQAASAMRVYRYRVIEKPNVWLVMIAPGCDLEEARQTLIGQFGAHRLLEIKS